MIIDTNETGFEPKVLGIVLEKDLSNGGVVEKKYEVAVDTFTGKLSDSVYVDSLHNINWFELFNCPDAHLSSQQRTILEYEMQRDVAKLQPEEKLLCGQGLQFYEEKIPIFVCGDKIFTSENELLKECHIKQGCEYQLKGKDIISSGLAGMCKVQTPQYIQLIPEITPILFYGSLLSILKPILAKLGKNVDFIIAVIGAKGHLKTSMVKMYALWLKNDVQKIDFTSGIKKHDIEQKILALAGHNLLMDDLHEMKAGYSKNRMRDRLDTVTRLISNNVSCTNVFVTGESIKDIAIDSTRDRMFQISVPKMDGARLDELKRKKDELDDGFMAEVAVSFVDAIIKNYDAVVEDIEDFLIQYQPSEFLSGSTRISSHMKFMQLAEFLYKKYICDNREDLSCTEALNKALEKQAKIQEKELLSQETEIEEDYVVVFRDMLEKEQIELESDRDSYSFDYGKALVCDRKIYITQEVLQRALLNRYKRVVPVRLVTNALHNAGILDEDKDARTKKFINKRHYVVSTDMLEYYCEVKEKQECL